MFKASQYKVIRNPVVLNRYPLSRSHLFNHINQGLFPEPISLGERAVGWLEHEVDAVISARAIGKSEEEIKSLVKSLKEQRHNWVRE